MKKENILSVLIILAVVVLAYFIINLNFQEVPEETARCIGNNSVLYVQLGCSHCRTQENLFGESYKYINFVDCFYERQKCIDLNIQATPTWVIKGEKYSGVQEINKLKELTGC